MSKDPKKSHWMRVWTWLQDHPDAPKFLLNLADSKTYRIRNQRATMAPKFPEIRQKLAKAANPQSVKRALKAECEDLCKKIVKARDLNENGVGRCNTCGALSSSLQWCHFIPRQKAKCLIYSPEATAMGCGACNGPGQGMYPQFRAWLEAKAPGLAERLERDAAMRKSFSWTLLNLKAKKLELESQWNDMQNGGAFRWPK